MKKLKQLYNSNDDFKRKDKYSSISYNMTRFDEAHKELDKTYYIENDVKRLDRMREILNNGITKSGYVPPREDYLEIQKYFDDIIEFNKKKENCRLFYSIWVWESVKRELEIKCYLDVIIQKADRIAEKSIFDAVCYLIDQKYIYHKNVLDQPKDDLLLREEINMLIFDYLQLKINELTQKETPESSTEKIMRPKKPFVWNSSKMSFGTLFGVLFNSNIITGNKTDFINFITEVFEGVPAKSTLKGNIYLKTDDENENKKYYCTGTVDLLTDWLEFLKSTPQNKNNSKG
ncbi:hypothetical protein [Chryseobacterium sp. HMWF035]|uniref:hypothetical protein n=1 Tax=Chryseobacterium sp. HMWF035 TaxID=2056868 RepID=UPI000D580D44|nr:hypothetical protein [Chryseobacterium sp. HMWF035]PVV54810.1 hypothetical protein DD829_16455 [Chryseobacterium sp. HMWF035]